MFSLTRSIKHRRCAGFSLVETLVALAISSILVVMFARATADTRANAANILEFVTMMELSESLFEQTAVSDQGTMEGSDGGLAWRTVAVPISFTAVAGYVIDGATPGKSIDGRPPSITPGLTTAKDFSPARADSTAGEAFSWIPFHVITTVQSRSGRKYIADSITLANPATSPK
jgi:prepilin-type N-terminal cleavage/methylation domain-containing protein